MIEAFFLLFIALPIGIAISVAVGIYISSEKGRSALEGGALGCLLGPIGWIIAGILPAQEKIDANTHWTCPYCAETVLRAAHVCKHCHRDLPAAPMPAPAAPEPRREYTPEERHAFRRQNIRAVVTLLGIVVLGFVGFWLIGMLA